MILAMLVLAGIAQRNEQEHKLLIGSEWSKLAKKRGGVYKHSEERFWQHSFESIECDSGKARVLLDIRRSTDNSTYTLYTRARARFPLGSGPVYRVTGAGHRPDSTLQRVVLGRDEQFDKLFFAQGGSEVETRRAWTPRAMRIMCEELQEVAVYSDGETITVELDDYVGYEGPLNAMIDLAGDLASVDLHGIAVLESLPRAAYRKPTGAWDSRTGPVVEFDYPSTVVAIGPMKSSMGIVTRARASGIPQDRHIYLAIEREAGLEDAPLSVEVKRALAVSGPGTFVCENGTATFTWTRIETDKARLEAATRALVKLASAPSLGVFR